MKKTFNLRKKNEVDELLKLLNKEESKNEVNITEIPDRIDRTESAHKVAKPPSNIEELLLQK